MIIGKYIKRKPIIYDIECVGIGIQLHGPIRRMSYRIHDTINRTRKKFNL